MSKKLRLFFLSVMVVLLGVSAAMAATINMTASGDTAHSPGYYSFDIQDAGVYITIYHDGVYTFESGDIAKITISDSKYPSDISNVTLELPAPNPDKPGYGTGGAWSFDWSAASKTNVVNFTIAKNGTNSAIVSNSINFEVPAYVNFTLNAPIRVSPDMVSMNFQLAVSKDGVFTFGPEGRIYGSSSDVLNPTGFVGASSGSYDIKPGGKVVIQNEWALKGSNLVVNVSRDSSTYGTLEIAIPGATLDLRGKPEIDSTSVSGAKINADGYISVNKALTLIGELHAVSGDIHKNGTGTLTLTQVGKGTKSAWPEAALSADVGTVHVEKGGLVLDGQHSWEAESGAGVVVSNDAAFTANEKSILEKGTSFDIKVLGTSTATFKQHAICKGSEIYPYDDYSYKDNGMTINVEGVAVEVEKNAKLIVDGGSFALSTLKGSGTVTMTGSSEESPDKVVLIFTSPDVSMSSDLNFEGSIEGNIGFYAVNPLSYDAQMFASGDFSGVDNVLVYGPSILAIDEKTYEYIKDVKNIWLRGHRPGADNSKENVATSGLTVGGLILGNSASFDETSKDAVIEMSTNLKIDGTSNPNKVAVIKLGNHVYASLGTVEFYANKVLDFSGTYTAPATGIRVLIIDGSEQPSKLVLDGSAVTGEGVEADAKNTTDKVYQVVITDSSDVRFLGNNGNEHHPIGKNNSLFVGKDGKLEMGRGAVIDGHLEFEGSTKAVATEYSALESLDYPQESWFASDDNRWNLESLDGYSVFTTVVAKNNRVTGSLTSDTSEYAVKVAGDITFSRDVAVTPGMTSYPGRVLVRTKANTNAFDGVQLTTLQRFRTVGSTGSSTTYIPDFVTVYNPTYLWRVTPVSTDVAKGVIIENRAEFALLRMGDFSFTKGADTFGNGEFEAQAAVTAWAKGDELTIETTSNDTYVLRRGSDVYNVKSVDIFFRENVEGEETAMSNIFDESEWSTTFSSGDILMTGSFRIVDGKPLVELRGHSYGGYTFVDVTVMLRFAGEDVTMGIAGVIPAYKTAPLSPGGLGDKFSTAKTYALEPFTFIAGDPVSASFVVEDIVKSTSTTTTSVELVNNVYVHKVKAIEGSYFIPDENGSSAKISNLRVVRYNGTDYTESDPVETEEDPVIAIEGNRAVITVASSALGDTGDSVSATKWLALRGDTSDGTLTTAPVAYTLLIATSPDNIITETGDLNQTVLIGGDSVSARFEVPLSAFSGDVTLHPVNLPAWLGYNGGSNMISYTTGSLTAVNPGVYTFQVIAQDEAGNHKIYQFNVTVIGEIVPHIEPVEDTTTINVVAGETQTVTLTFVSGDATTVTWSFTPEGIPGLLTGVASENTYTLTANAAGVEAGSYAYVVSVNDGAYTRNVTVVVTAAAFEVADEPNDATYEGYNYRNVVTAAGATGKVTWTVTPARASDTWLTWVESGDDQLVLAGVLPDYDDGEDADNDHVFRITASVGTVYADNASTEEPYEITVSVEEDTMLPVSASADIVRPAEGVALGSVDKNYSVTVVFPTDPDEEGTVVASDYILDETSINLPEWISYKVISRDDNDDVLAIRLVVNPVPGVANGTKGTVRIPADGVTLGWNVVYNAASPLEITASPVAVSFDSPTAAAKTVTLSATNAIGTVTYTASLDKTGLTAAVSGDVLTLTPSAAGSYTVTVTGSTATQTATATVNVTVNSGTGPTPGSFSITATPAAVSFDSPTASAKTVTLSTNFLGATVTYTASVDKTGLSADVSGDVLTLTPSAAGTYTVTVTGTNGTNTATATVNVTVNSGTGPTPTDFSISVSRSSVTFDSPTASAQTVTLSATGASGSVSYTTAVSPATGLTASVSGTTLTLTPSAAGTYVVTVTGTNGTRTATATVNVTVSSGSTPTTFSISASRSSVTFTSVSAAVQTVTLSATNASGSVNYTAEVTASSTGSTGLTDGLDLTVSGNTLTIDPLEAGTYTVTITGNTTTQTATTTITVVVTSAVARVGSSGGGCDAGFGALALVLAAPLFLRRRRS